MLLDTSFKLNLVITVEIKHTLHCLYIELYEESVIFGVVVFKASMLDWGVDLPGDLHIWALIVNIQNCHSDQLADLPGRGIDLPGDLPSFCQDRVDPISAWNMQFMDTKW